MTATGATIEFTARPTHYDESLDRECPGTTAYSVGDREAPCDTCGGRTGWIAAAAEEHARLARALRDFPQQEFVEFALERAARYHVCHGEIRAGSTLVCSRCRDDE